MGASSDGNGSDVGYRGDGNLGISSPSRRARKHLHGREVIHHQSPCIDLSGKLANLVRRRMTPPLCLFPDLDTFLLVSRLSILLLLCFFVTVIVLAHLLARLILTALHQPAVHANHPYLSTLLTALYELGDGGIRTFMYQQARIGAHLLEDGVLGASGTVPENDDFAWRNARRCGGMQSLARGQGVGKRGWK